MLYDKFYANKELIEQVAGIRFTWDRLDNKKASLVCTYIKGLDFNNQTNYPDLMQEAIDKVLLFKRVFTPYL